MLWDLVRSCCREGSGDSRIQKPVLNNIPALIQKNPGLRLVALNGTTARKYFEQIAMSSSDVVTLPSTSPAHARMTIKEKTDKWRVICSYLDK